MAGVVLGLEVGTAGVAVVVLEVKLGMFVAHVKGLDLHVAVMLTI